MASCVQIFQDLTPLCCDGDEVTGNATINLVGGACQLFDPETNAWLSPGRVGTFNVGAVTSNQWISCQLLCLEDIVGPGGQTAIDLGFYYEIIVKIAGTTPCTYEVALDCTTLGLADGAVIPLQDVIVATPVGPVPGSALCDAFSACETTTTLVDNGDGTATYTNEDGNSTTISISGTGAAASQLSVAGSVITHTAGDGTIVSFDVCQVVADNCENSLDFNPTTGDLTLTLHGGATDVVNIGSSETITTLVNNGDGTYTYTSENGTSTIIDASVGPVGLLSDNGNGTISYDPGDGSTPVVIDICDVITAGNCGGGGSGDVSQVQTFIGAGQTIATHTAGGNTIDIRETVTTFTDNGNGTYTFTSEDGTVTTTATPGAETVTTLVDNGDGTYTYTSENGTVTVISAPQESVTTLTVNNGVATYVSENGTVTTFATSDTEKMTFAHPTLVTEPSCSGLAIDDNAYEIYGYAVTVDSAPTGDETFNLVDRGPAGTGATTVFSGTLTSGTFTTGIVNIAPYTVAAGNLIQSNILTVGAPASEKLTLTVFFRELISELI